jgi:hypothetical protein
VAFDGGAVAFFSHLAAARAVEQAAVTTTSSSGGASKSGGSGGVLGQPVVFLIAAGIAYHTYMQSRSGGFDDAMGGRSGRHTRRQGHPREGQPRDPRQALLRGSGGVGDDDTAEAISRLLRQRRGGGGDAGGFETHMWAAVQQRLAGDGGGGGGGGRGGVAYGFGDEDELAPARPGGALFGDASRLRALD